MSTEFYERYFKYIGQSESPTIYHRWTAVSIVGALLGRQVYFPFGHDNIYPNFYILLVGDPGTRKNTAIGPGRKAIKTSGYNKLSPDRLSPERFIIALERSTTAGDNLEQLNVELEDLTVDEPCEIYVSIGEFGDFIGKGNFDFVKLLTNLWDNLDEYQHPKIHGKSARVNKPTVSILAGTTPQSISEDIPVAAIGQGFFSRFILVHSEASGIKITFPEPVPPEAVKEFSDYLIKIRNLVKGEIQITPKAREICDRLYKEFIEIPDHRFKHYSTRRFTHLLKLAMIMAAMACRTTITEEDCINANTLLFYTERRMPDALGEFGKAKNADVTNSVMAILKSAGKPVLIKELYKQVSKDLNKMTELVDIMNNLLLAERVQKVETPDHKLGYVPRNEVKRLWSPELLNDDFLTMDERK